MNRPAILVLFGAAIAVGVFAYRSARGPAPAPSEASPSLPADAKAPAPGQSGPEQASAPSPAAGAAASVPAQADAEGRTDAPLTRRPVTLYERDTVRELIKLHAESGLGDKGELDSSLPEPAWPVDDDSLFVKYGSFNKARIQEALVSTQAILDWQNEGPFEDKTMELLPPPLLRAFELEREWLIQRLQDM